MLDGDKIATIMLDLINEEREALGRCELNTAPIAHKIATIRADELQISYGHYRPHGDSSGTIFTEFRYGERNGEIGVPDGQGGWTLVPAYSPGGRENICPGGGQTTITEESEATAFVEAFKSSTNHWNDITNETYTGVGIGVSVALKYGDKGYYYEVYCAVLTMSKTYG